MFYVVSCSVLINVSTCYSAVTGTQPWIRVEKSVFCCQPQNKMSNSNGSPLQHVIMSTERNKSVFISICFSLHVHHTLKSEGRTSVEPVSTGSVRAGSRFGDWMTTHTNQNKDCEHVELVKSLLLRLFWNETLLLLFFTVAEQALKWKDFSAGLQWGDFIYLFKDVICVMSVFFHIVKCDFVNRKLNKMKCWQKSSVFSINHHWSSLTVNAL